jgi:hypothetical protein
VLGLARLGKGTTRVGDKVGKYKKTPAFRAGVFLCMRQQAFLACNEREIGLIDWIFDDQRHCGVYRGIDIAV